MRAGLRRALPTSKQRVGPSPDDTLPEAIAVRTATPPTFHHPGPTRDAAHGMHVRHGCRAYRSRVRAMAEATHEESHRWPS